MIGNIVAGSIGRKVLLSYKDTVLADNPVGFWMLDETSGTNADDSTTNNNDLTYENSPTLNVSTGLTGLTKAITLNGTNQRVFRTNTATFNQSPAGNWSMELWLRFSISTLATPYAVRNTDAQSTTQLAVITVNNTVTGRIQGLFLDAAGTASITINSDGGWNDNNWHHVVLTSASGGAATLYVDGVSRASSSAGRYVDTSNKAIYVGSNTASQYYSGSLSAPAIYGSTLSADKVYDHYSAGI